MATSIDDASHKDEVDRYVLLATTDAVSTKDGAHHNASKEDAVYEVTPPSAVDSTDQPEYLHGLHLITVYVALLLAMFLVALDMVSQWL